MQSRILAMIFGGGMLFTVPNPVIADEYFIVRGADNDCTVVESRPEREDLLVVGDLFVTRESAEERLSVVCDDDDDDEVVVRERIVE